MITAFRKSFKNIHIGETFFIHTTLSKPALPGQNNRQQVLAWTKYQKINKSQAKAIECSESWDNVMQINGIYPFSPNCQVSSTL